MKRRLRISLIAAVAVLFVAGAATTSRACEFLDCLLGKSTANYATYYAPTVAYSPCGTTCGYVPQTSYRTVYSQVPYRAYQPISSCDPCTGSPVTTYRPLTYYRRQAQMIPYTSYRALNVQSCLPTCGVSCDPCGTSCGTDACGVGGCETGACGISGGITGGISSNCTDCTPAAAADSSLQPTINGSTDPTVPSATFDQPKPAPTGETTNYQYQYQRPPVHDRMTMRDIRPVSNRTNKLPVIGDEMWKPYKKK